LEPKSAILALKSGILGQKVSFLSPHKDARAKDSTLKLPLLWRCECTAHSSAQRRWQAKKPTFASPQCRKLPSSLYSCAQRMPQLRRICVAPPSYRARHHEGGQKAWRLVTGKSGVALGLSPSAQVLDPHYVCPPHPHYLCPPHPALNILDSIYLSVPAPQPLWT